MLSQETVVNSESGVKLHVKLCKIIDFNIYDTNRNIVSTV
jgi:hypothetical protein